MAQSIVTKDLRNRVAASTSDLPTLAEWLVRMSTQAPELRDAIEGIYCGRDGRMIESIDSRHNLVAGWHDGRVEYAYVS